MQSMFKRAVAVRVVLTASVLVLASCSDSGGGGSSGGLIPAEDQSGTTTQPPVANPPVANPPVDETPVVNPPVDETPVAPPVEQPPAGATGYESLYGRATFEADFIESDEILRFFATFSEDGLQPTDDGNALIVANDTGIYQTFGCQNAGATAGAELFLCLGVFDGGDVNLFVFELSNGIGDGFFEECFGQEAADLDACLDDFTQTPDGLLTVTIAPASPAARAGDDESVLSASEFHAMMEVNGQATRFGLRPDETSDAQRALKAQTSQLWTHIQEVLN